MVHGIEEDTHIYMHALTIVIIFTHASYLCEHFQETRLIVLLINEITVCVSF